MTPNEKSKASARGSIEFAGLTAIVTGGASGIGRATVDRLLAEGCRCAGP